MKKLFATLVTASVLFAATAQADVYMHNPRGSNNSTTNSSSSDSTVQALVDWLSSLF